MVHPELLSLPRLHTKLMSFPEAFHTLTVTANGAGVCFFRRLYNSPWVWLNAALFCLTLGRNLRVIGELVGGGAQGVLEVPKGLRLPITTSAPTLTNSCTGVSTFVCPCEDVSEAHQKFLTSRNDQLTGCSHRDMFVNPSISNIIVSEDRFIARKLRVWFWPRAFLCVVCMSSVPAWAHRHASWVNLHL